MHICMPNEKEHLAALAQHKTVTQARYYRVHNKLVETDLEERPLKAVVLKLRKLREEHTEDCEPPSDI